MTRKFVLLTLLVVIASSVLVLAQEDRCSNFTIVGRYAIRCSGELVPGPGAPEIPFAAFGEALIDSRGHITVARSCNNIGGQVQYAPLEGQGVVYPDCTTTVRYYPLGYKNMNPPLPDTDWIFFIRANILRQGKQLQGFILEMQDPAHNFAPIAPPAAQCTLTLMSRSFDRQAPDPTYCSAPPVN